MADTSSDTSGATPVAPTAPSGFVLTDAQFSALLAAAKGHSAVSVIATDAKAVGDDVIARMKQVIADAEGTASHVHGAAKSLQADVKANWPILLAILLGAAGFALHFVKVFGYGG
jgi:hypothetical protein